MTDETTRHRALAAKLWARLVRRSDFHEITGGRSVVCLESDSVDRMLETLLHHYPNTTTVVAIYFPRAQEFRFMEWGSDADWDSEGVPGSTVMTLGMVVDSLRTLNQGFENITVPRPRYSTAALERELTAV